MTVGSSWKRAVTIGAATLPLGLLLACQPPAVSCIASTTNPHPVRNGTVPIIVSSQPGNKILTLAQYRTTSTAQVGLVGVNGQGEIDYRISRATPSFTVKVTVVVANARHQSAACATSFTPQ